MKKIVILMIFVYGLLYGSKIKESWVYCYEIEPFMVLSSEEGSQKLEIRYENKDISIDIKKNNIDYKNGEISFKGSINKEFQLLGTLVLKGEVIDIKRSPKKMKNFSIQDSKAFKDNSTFSFKKSILSSNNGFLPNEIQAKNILKKRLYEAKEKFIRQHREESIRIINEMSDSQRVIFTDKNLFVLESFTYYYGGGAHGMRAVDYDIFYNGNFISADDFLKKEKSLALVALIETKVKNDSSIVLYDDVKIELSDIFYLDNEGVVFVYNPYEIGPFSSGIIKVKIDYKEIKEFVNLGLIGR